MNTEVRLDITDWVQEMIDIEPVIACEDDLVQLVKGGLSAGQVARVAIAARENGLAPESLLRTNKLLFYSGARSEVDDIMASRKREAIMPNGAMMQIREFIGAIPTKEEEEDEQERGFVTTQSDEGLRLARRYLYRVIPGHIFNRLKELAAAGEDVEEAWDQLKEIGDEMVARLVEERETELA